MITETTIALIEACLCGGTSFREETVHGIPVRRCDCGIAHQVVNMTAEEYADFYRNRYLREVYTHDEPHDYQVANQRLDRHGKLYRDRALDVGTGNGAFVRAARERGFDTYGQDIADFSPASIPFTYTGPLETIHFPTDYFQTVTINDVLEHVPDPKTFLAEVFRLTDQEGTCIIDFPDFQYAHHWKPIEHLWLLDADQLWELVRSVGFEILFRDHPIEGKVVLYCRKPKQKRVSILTAPGIGDALWSITKIKSFCESRHLGLPDVYVAAPDDRKRSLEFVRKIPFLKAAGYRDHSAKSALFQEAYMQDGRSLFPNVAGCDWFLAANGAMRFGKSMDEILPELKTDWHFPMFRSWEQRQAAVRYREQYGDFVVAYFIDAGMYKAWLHEFNEAAILQTLKLIQAWLNCRILFIGSSWDRDGLAARLTKVARDPNFIDLTSKTNIDEMFALFESAKGVIGFPSGATIMATVMKRPCLQLWQRYFDERFWKNACPPDSSALYRPMNTAGATPESVAGAFGELVSCPTL